MIWGEAWVLFGLFVFVSLLRFCVGVCTCDFG